MQILLKGPPQRMQVLGGRSHDDPGVGVTVSMNADPKIWRIPRGVPTEVPSHIAAYLVDSGFELDVFDSKASKTSKGA